MNKSKKLTEGVPVVDSSGAVTPVSIAELAKQIGAALGLANGISCRNLINSDEVTEYYDAVDSENRTYPINFKLSNHITLKAGESISLGVESVTPISGGYVQTAIAVKDAETGYIAMSRGIFTDGKKHYTYTAPQDITISDVYIYGMNSAGVTGLVHCVYRGLTLVKGTVPMTGWIPSPEKMAELFGGGKSLLISRLYNNERRAAA